MHRLARIRQPWIKNWCIDQFIRYFNVDLSEAQIHDAHAFHSFNEFFTRALQADARPIAPGNDKLASPVDGTISQIGKLRDATLLQAKGRSFRVAELLGCDQLAQAFQHGAYATLYLSPRDYHRIHMPVAATLAEMIYIPGRLFSVNPPTTRQIPRLFARNERVVNYFDTALGPMALVMVGAIFVASMQTVWSGTLLPQARRVKYTERHKVQLDKGAEMGRFKMGSTVILLFANPDLHWNQQALPGNSIKMGAELGALLRRT